VEVDGSVDVDIEVQNGRTASENSTIVQPE
jgi:hypothetical protein